ESAGGIRNGRCNCNSVGICANRSSVDLAPIAASISCRSSGVFRIYASDKEASQMISISMPRRFNLFLILFVAKQVRSRSAGLYANFHEPALAEGIVLDRFGIVDQRVIHG